MTDEMKANDATRYLVVAMDSDSFKVLHIKDNMGEAKGLAEDAAEKEDGRIVGVFQKIGTARTVRKVEWKGHAA